MKNQLTKFLFILIAIAISKFAYDKYQTSKNSHFTVTADTIIKPGSEISKYVTQEEVDSFALRYWDIDIDKVKDNPLMENFRQILKSKNTTDILRFMKDNNIGVDTPLHYGVTPLMYASFYDDEETIKELIKLGADTNATDRYKLSPIAYAIENNSTKAVKTLLDNGTYLDVVKMKVQHYQTSPSYSIGLDGIVIDGDNMILSYEDKYGGKAKHGFGDGTSVYGYIISHNFIEIMQMLLERGYIHPTGLFNHCKKGDDFNSCSVYSRLNNIPNHEPMLNLLLDHNVSGQPSEELLKKEYDRCYKENYKECFNKDNSCRPVFEIYDEIRALNVMYKLFKNYCPDKNGTFKNTKEFIAFKNEDKKEYAISSFKNKNPEKVFIKDKNMTLDKLREYEYKNSEDENERNFIKTYYLKTN